MSNVTYSDGQLKAFNKIEGYGEYTRTATITDDAMRRTFEEIRKGDAMEDEHLRNVGRRGRKLPSLPS